MRTCSCLRRLQIRLQVVGHISSFHDCLRPILKEKTKPLELRLLNPSGTWKWFACAPVGASSGAGTDFLQEPPKVRRHDHDPCLIPCSYQSIRDPMGPASLHKAWARRWLNVGGFFCRARTIKGKNAMLRTQHLLLLGADCAVCIFHIVALLSKPYRIASTR